MVYKKKLLVALVFSAAFLFSPGAAVGITGTTLTVDDIVQAIGAEDCVELDIKAVSSMVYMRAISFDSSKGKPALPVELSISEYPVDIKGYYIVQFIEPVKSEWKDDLNQMGCEIYDYIPDNAFIVSMDSETKEIVKDMDFVQWIGIYQPAYKIDPKLPEDETEINITVLLFEPGNREEISSALKELGGEVQESSGDVIRLIINASKMEDIAKINDVEWIEKYIQPQILNDVSKWVIQSYVYGEAPVWAYNITGSGQIIGISDSGLDYDCCFFWDSVRGAPPEDSGLPSSVSPDYDQRKVIVYHDVAEFGDYDDNGGHGTHTSGSIAGDNHATIGGYDTNDGMAYNAKLVFQDLGRDGSSSIYPPPDFNDLFRQAYDDGARIHSNSWGSSADGAYTTASKQCDEFTWNYKDFLILFSNGNSGSGSNTVDSPASAKNVVSVGATENGALAENMAYFSSHGPTDDGRMKPSVCAPGVSIWSADSDGNINSHNCGVASMSGTSMSCPTTAGAAALIRQYFVDGYCPTGSATPGDSITPSAALIKAMLINSGEEMNGSYTGGPIPSNGQGWGRILLDNALYFDGEARRLEIYDSDSVDTGESKTYDIAIDNQSESLEITLVWTDYPSTPAAAINLVNDLNLAVTGPGGTYTTSDNRNVVESVYIKTPSVGTYTITVTGYNVPEGPQPFALVITGGLGIGSKGVVYLGRDTYNCSGMVNATVKDADLNADNTTIEMAYVSIMSFPTEATPENITLTETGVDTATFTGSIRLTTSPPVPDGNLSVAHRDLMIVFYMDADDGTGNALTVYDTAAVDCLVPVITVAAPQNNTTYSSNSVDLNYSVNERTQWEGYSLDGQPIVIISGNTTLTNLTDGWHNVTVFAGDVAGNIGASDLVWFNITTPDIWVHPESFEVILPQGNITNETLTIGNNGTGVLEFEITGGNGGGKELRIGIVQEGDYANYEILLTNLGYTWIDVPATVTASWLQANDIGILIQDGYGSAHMDSAQVLEYQKFYDDGGSLWISYDDISTETTFEPEMCTLIGASDFADAPESQYITFITATYPNGEPTNVYGRILDFGQSDQEYVAPNTCVVLDDWNEATIQDGGNKFVLYLGDTVGSVSDVSATGTLGLLFDSFVDMWEVRSGVDWLTEYPQNGTIDPGNQINITVTFNATDLDVGRYDAAIAIDSNDPDECKVEVPVRLIVTQTHPPDIWVYPESFNITAFEGEAKYENLTIGNNGTGDLTFNISVIQHQAMTDDVNITGNVPMLWRYYTGSLVYSSPAIGDIDGDGKPEVVIGSDSNCVYALNGEDGSMLWSYCVTYDVSSSPAIADIDGDGKSEIIFGTEGGYVYVLNGEDGSILWSYYTGYNIYYSSPAIGDIDGDGKQEIVIGCGYYVYALNGEDGSNAWSYHTSGSVYSSPAIGDIDGDGKIEVVFGSYDNYVYALNGEDGSRAWSYYTDGDVTSSPALGDIDGDGKLEVVVGSRDNHVYVLNGEDGSMTWSYYTGGNIDRTSPALGDIDGDGNLEIVIGSGYYVYALNHDGSMAWSYYTSGSVYSSPAIGDIDGDGKKEVVIGSDRNYVYALNGEDGSEEWSYYTGGDVSSSPAIEDIDGDGDTDIVVGSEDYYVYALDCSGVYDPGNIEWGTFHHDNMRTGLYALIKWVNVTPKSDIVYPKNQTNVTIEINATSLDAGAYNATITIMHNDILHDTVNVPVNLIVFSAPHDIAVTNITAPDFAEINSTMVIDSIINNFGSNDESNVTIDFMVDGVINQSKIISLASSSSTNVSFAWTAPGTPGVYNLTIYAEPIPGENITQNNQLSKNISVITIPDIWVYPEWFGLTLEKGEVTSRTLMIGNNGTGILNASISASLPTDVDQDNEQEIIVRDCWGYTYVVNNSNLDTFNGWEWRSPYTDSYKGFAIADVNGDGTPDLLEGGYNYLRVYDIKNNSVLYSDLYTGCSYGGTAAGDIDNDGSVEMLVSDYDGYIYVYDGKTGLPDAQGHITYPTAYYGTGLGIGDIDNDGVAEVIRADRYGIDIFNGETRVLEGEISISSLYGYPDLIFGDANANGIADIYVGGEYGYVYAYEWNGFAATQLWRSLDIGSYTRPCGFADADNDGDFEVFIGNSSGYITALNALTGGVEGSVFTGYYSYASCTVGDIDNDGVLEIATGNGDGYIRTYTYSNGRFTLKKKSVTYYGSDLGRYTDSMIISGAKDPRVFREVSFIQFNETEVSVPPDSSHNVTVFFDATDLNKGTYNATIDINSNDPDETMVNIPVNMMVITPPHIISFSPIDPTPTQYVGTTNTFSVITDQVMTSNDWYVMPDGIATLGNDTSSLTLTWAHPCVYNITYIGTNENGSVNTTWVVTVSEPGVPIITDWYNNKTEDNSTSVTINESELVYFSATADQPVDTWNWRKDGVDQGLNYDNLTTSWSVNGTYTIVVNASNAFGTSNTVVWNVTVKDVPSIEVDKTVWNPASRTWEKSIEANVSEIVRFRCIIHNDGNCNLTNVTAADNLPESLEYAYNATHPEHWISADNRTIVWLFGPIAPCENVTIEFDVHVVRSESGTNMYNATAWCGETGTWVYDEDSVIINPSQLPPTPFLIHGWVYGDEDPVNNPDVNITNLNTSEAFVVETNESSNYYQVLTDSEDANTNNVLHFYASDDGNVTEFDHVITQEEVNNGGFEQNITISLPSRKPDLVVAKEWVCDNCTICYNVTNIGDGIAQAGHNTTLYVDGEEVAYNIVPVVLVPGEGYTGCFDYIWTYTPPSDNITVCADFNNTIEESNETNNCLTGVWKCGDVDENGIVNIMDVRLLMKNVSCPGYPVDPWAGDVTGNGVIDSDDVQLLVAHVFDPAGHLLNCSTPVCS